MRKKTNFYTWMDSNAYLSLSYIYIFSRDSLGMWRRLQFMFRRVVTKPWIDLELIEKPRWCRCISSAIKIFVINSNFSYSNNYRCFIMSYQTTQLEQYSIRLLYSHRTSTISYRTSQLLQTMFQSEALFAFGGTGISDEVQVICHSSTVPRHLECFLFFLVFFLLIHFTYNVASFIMLRRAYFTLFSLFFFTLLQSAHYHSYACRFSYLFQLSDRDPDWVSNEYSNQETSVTMGKSVRNNLLSSVPPCGHDLVLGMS